MGAYFLLSNYTASTRWKKTLHSEGQKKKTQRPNKDVCMNLFVFPYIFCQGYSRSQCHCGSISKTLICISKNKTRLLLLANAVLILSASKIGNIVGIYHFPLCYLYWQDMALRIIARVFVMIKICVEAFYLALSALIGEMTDQHVWQKPLLWNCIVPKCQVQTLWQPFPLYTELQIRTHHNYASVVRLVCLNSSIKLILFSHSKYTHSKTQWYKLRSQTWNEFSKGEPIWFQLCPYESPDQNSLLDE